VQFPTGGIGRNPGARKRFRACSEGQQIRCDAGADGIVRMEESKAKAVVRKDGSAVFVRPREVSPVRENAFGTTEAGNSAQPLKDRLMTISKIEDAIAAIARGEMVVVVDDQNRENEGDIVFASEDATAEKIAFMMNNARGLICVAMQGERLDALDIPLMVPNNTESLKTAFTVSVDYLPDTTTGISAGDRAATIRALIDPLAKPEEFARPGHIFPLRANPDGVLARPGHTEAAIDLCRLAGKVASGVICEVAKDDGTMARLPDLELFAEQHSLHLVTIEDLIGYLQASNPAAADLIEVAA
jgi:3,4-dihydroxy 2-butanone 4-phosphate synthase